MVGKLFYKVKNMSLPAKASIAYTISHILSKGVSIITVPIYTRLLTTAEVGVGTTYSSWYGILYAVVTLSLTSGSLNIAMMEYKDRRDEYESSCLSICVINGIVFSAFCLLFYNKLENITTLSNSIMALICISLIINPALDIWYARQRYEYKYKSSVVVSLCVTVLSAVVAIGAIVMYKGNDDVDLGEVKVLAQGIVLLTISAFAFVYIFIKGKVLYNKEIWKNALVWSLPLVVHSISKNILDLSDRLMISSMCGKSEAGIYGTVYSLSMLSLVVWNAINSSLIPTSFEKLEKEDYSSLNFIVKGILVVFGGVAIIVTLMAPEILRVFTTEEYLDAVYLIPALSVGIYFTSLYNVFGNFLLFKKKTTNIMIGTLVAAFSNIILNIIFISMFGYIAAAYTTLVSFIILAIMQGIMCKHVFERSIIDTFSIVVISVCVGIICMSCNLLYRFLVIRFILVAVIVLAALLNKNRIMKNILRRDIK